MKKQALSVTPSVTAGFPTPAGDYLETPLDLNELLIQHPAATFFVRVSGDSMVGVGIHDGDLLVVDRSLEPISGKIVIAIVNGELTVKQLLCRNNQISLLAANEQYAAIDIKDGSEFEIWGVVVHVIHKL